MLQRDYLLKLIEEAAAVIARLVGLRLENKYEEALKLLQQTYESFFKLEGKLIRITEEDQLLDVLVKREGLNEDQLDITADLLRQEAEIWFDKGDWEEGKKSLRKSIIILYYLNQNQSRLYSIERVNKLNAIEDRLKEVDDKK